MLVRDKNRKKMEEEKMDKKQKKISDLEQRAKEKIFEKAQIKVIKK